MYHEIGNPPYQKLIHFLKNLTAGDPARSVVRSHNVQPLSSSILLPQYSMLVGGLVAINFLFSHINWECLIIPIDELIFFRGVAKKPPTSDGQAVKNLHT